MYELKEFPEFSWSHTRDKTLKACPRKYGYEYYFSHNGWLANSAPINQHAYRLKKMVTLPMLFGQIVHTMIERTINQYEKTGYVPEPEELEQQVRHNLRTAFLESRDSKESWQQSPGRYTMLREMYYHGSLSTKSVREIQQRLHVCLKHFLTSKSFRDIKSPQKKLHMFKSEKFRQIELQNAKVYTVMDVIYKDLQKDKWIIVDWKTGDKPRDDLGQLSVYAVYLTKKLNIPVEKVEIRNENLLTGGCHTFYLTNENIEAAFDRINLSIKEMDRYKLNKEENKPKAIEHFPQTKNKTECKHCKYVELCASTI